MAQSAKFGFGQKKKINKFQISLFVEQCSV